MLSLVWGSVGFRAFRWCPGPNKKQGEQFKNRQSYLGSQVYGLPFTSCSTSDSLKLFYFKGAVCRVCYLLSVLIRHSEFFKKP